MKHFKVTKVYQKRKKEPERRIKAYILVDDVAVERLTFNNEIPATAELYARLAAYDVLVKNGKLNGYYRCFLTKDYVLV